MDYAIVLAAGEGTRMKSGRHKVLHEVCGRPLIEYSIDLARAAGVERPIVVIGDKAEQIRGHLGESAVYARQDFEKGYGTGAAACAAEGFLNDDSGLCFLMAGDAPMFKPESLLALRRAVEGGAAAAALLAEMEKPFGYGRAILRGDRLVDIVEEAAASEEQRRIHLVNVSLYCVKTALLKAAMQRLKPHPPKNELYLTDIVPILTKMGEVVRAVTCAEEDALGVNDRLQLARAQAAMQGRILEEQMRAGVTIIDPANTYIDFGVEIGADTVIYPGCLLQKGTKIGPNCTILQNCRIAGSILEEGVRVESSTLLEAHVGAGSTVGPNAHLRPGAVIGPKCRIGDFVEIKNSNIGAGTKISHLTYVGDADLGEGVNLGCGVVFSNYDGKAHLRSRVGDRAFIGCNVNLVAPVVVGEEAYIGAGSTITQDVEPGALAIARERQRSIPGWVEKRKKQGKL
ncbi:MAG: bifunctional UDP-N-acetylglucosamine diphosphorylase/glucosamine-1-phosphate N-acetyltransferase GlmU [Christensenellaceae bacterium]|nr:bifunctional UDP-N-acetylglucosamine diphosphorylase/glucosamine-1-phosphate N-acetyltransferase GlmU [Christensenellaceae bacterium]